MIKVGITGGIGSGKTTVCKIFESLVVPVYYADDRAKALMLEEPIKSQLISTFGSQCYHDEGKLDRAYLSSKVFNDKKALEKLNAIVHPVVIQDGIQWLGEMEKAGHRYALKEAALLFESGSHMAVDKVIVVTAPLETRISRVVQRDNTTREAVLARIQNQWPEERKVELADFVVVNDGESHLTPQIIKIHRFLMTIS